MFHSHLDIALTISAVYLAVGDRSKVYIFTNNTKGLYMKKTLLIISALISALLTLSSCDTIKADTISMSTIYIITTALSLLLLIGYCTLLKKKDTWFISLFASVFIVNAGYLSLSLSTSTQEALLANRISYLGSVMLPLAMIMIIKNSCKIKDFVL